MKDIEIVLVPEGDEDNAAWNRLAAANEAFDFLDDPAEDIYTLADGKAYQAEPIDALHPES